MKSCLNMLMIVQEIKKKRKKSIEYESIKFSDASFYNENKRQMTIDSGVIWCTIIPIKRRNRFDVVRDIEDSAWLRVLRIHDLSEGKVMIMTVLDSTWFYKERIRYFTLLTIENRKTSLFCYYRHKKKVDLSLMKETFTLLFLCSVIILIFLKKVIF